MWCKTCETAAWCDIPAAVTALRNHQGATKSRWRNRDSAFLLVCELCPVCLIPNWVNSLVTDWQAAGLQRQRSEFSLSWWPTKIWSNSFMSTQTEKNILFAQNENFPVTLRLFVLTFKRNLRVFLQVFLQLPVVHVLFLGEGGPDGGVDPAQVQPGRWGEAAGGFLCAQVRAQGSPRAGADHRGAVRSFCLSVCECVCAGTLSSCRPKTVNH